jgi:hypothetical protein
MAKLTFDVEALKPIVAHALASAAHSPTYNMMADPAYWKEGISPHPGGWAKAEDLDYSKIPAHLQLAKDHGVYLLSSGTPRLMDPADPGGQRSLVVYAKGMTPEDGWDAWQILGGDDFVESIDLAFVKKAIDMGAKRLNITITATKLSLDFEHERDTPPHPMRERPRVSSYEAKTAKALAGTGKSARWAAAGQTYTGAIYGFDTHVVFQKSGRSLIVHEKALLPSPYPQKGETVRIVYPSDVNGVATVGPVNRGRKSS